jgi:hypothetical protein
MSSSYPGSLDAFATNRTSGQTIQASTDNDHSDAINKIEAELGIGPSGSAATVKARLDALTAGATVNAADYGYVGDATADDTAAIVAALAALPTYSGGAGGGRVILPRTATNIAKVTSAITLTSGQRIVGDGPRGPVLRGTVAGPLINSASDAGFDPLSNYVGLENLYVYNQSTNSGALAVDFHQIGFLRFKGVTFQGAASGGYVVRLRACILVDFLERCQIGGAGVSSCEAGLLLNGACNVVHLDGISVTDAKSGVKALGGTNLVIDGASHFESLAGGAASNAAIALDGVQGGAVRDSYFESNPMSAVAAFSGVGPDTRGFAIGFNYMTNQGSYAIDATNMADCEIFPNIVVPGGNATNGNGVLATGSDRCTFHRQYLASGSGDEIIKTGATNAIFLEDLGSGSSNVDSNVFNGTSWPSRPSATTVLWIGGGSGDDPSADMDDGDLWFPSEA